MHCVKFKPFLISVFILFTISGCGSCVSHTNKGSEQNSEIDSERELLGIDLSHHNGTIDWDVLSTKNKIDFIYLKATEGKTYTDPKYHKNINKAREKGFKVGSYHFFRMTSGAHEQFRHIVEVVKKRDQDLIPMVDVETSDNRPVKEVQDSLQVLLDLLEEYYGAQPMIYATNRSYNELCAPKFNDYKLYIGRYGPKPPIIKGRNHYLVWQYSEEGKIPGIPKSVDLCRFYPKKNLTEILLK